MAAIGPRVTAAAIALVAVALFVWAVSPATRSFFTADDFLLVAVSVPADARDAARYFRTDWGGSETGGAYYRPLVNASLWLNREVTGLSPAALRATGLAMHVAVSMLVVLLARARFRLPGSPALLAGAVFLLLPIHDQAILWIAARVDLLCAVFYLVAFIGLTSRSVSGQIGGALAFAAALASKEMAVTLPGVVLVWWIVFGQSTRKTIVARSLGLATAVLVGYAIVRVTVLGGIGGDPRLLVFGSNMVTGALRMLGWALLPFDLERLRDFARVHPVLIIPLYALALAVLWIVVGRLWRNGVAWFGLAWIAVSMLPVVAGPSTWHAYIPSIGGCMVIAALCTSFARAHVAVGLIVLATAGTSLRGGARQMADAGLLSEMLVHAGARAGKDLFVVNSPIVINERYAVVTDQSHFDAAARILGLPHRTIPLNYAYVENVLDGRLSAIWNEKGIVAVADVGRRTFLTLDGIGVADTTAVAGEPLSGTRAVYWVLDVRRGHIASVQIVPTDVAFDGNAVAAFSGGRLVGVR